MPMTEDAASLKHALPASGARGRLFERVVPALKRYALSVGGPVSTSGAHFLTALILLRTLAPAEFGLFSFLLIVAPFCGSLSASLIGSSFITGLRQAGEIEDSSLATHLKANIVVAIAAFVAVSAVMMSAGAAALLGITFGLYASAMSLRWFGRTYSYASGKPVRVLACDMTYGTLLVGGMVTLLVTGLLTSEYAAFAMAGAAVLSLPALGRDHIARQIRPGGAGSLAAYVPRWREITRWAAAGVILTEFTANAHAYIVTFIAGPKAFALLAIGALAMRPASLVLTALPDIERPRIARKIGTKDVTGAYAIVRDFRLAAAAVWLGALGLAASLLIWAPHVLLKKGYDADQALIVIAIWGVILAVRTMRTPESVFLQAAGEFRDLAGASLWASVTAITMTLALLLAFGPIAALGGILAGDLVMTTNIFRLTRAWKREHGKAAHG